MILRLNFDQCGHMLIGGNMKKVFVCIALALIMVMSEKKATYQKMPVVSSIHGTPHDSFFAPTFRPTRMGWFLPNHL